MASLYWPQLTWVVLAALALGAAVILHGKPCTGTYSMWTALVRVGIMGGVLACGGFFDVKAQSVPQGAQRHRSELVRAARSTWGLDAPVAVFAAQVHQESGWRADAVSQVGAQGLSQFMPATARWWCEVNGLARAACQPANPVWALRALVGYDRWLFERTPAHYAPHDRMHVALRAYNGGLGHWQAEARATGLPQPTVDQVAAACGQARRHVSHCQENLAYPRRILMVLQPRYLLWGPGV